MLQQVVGKGQSDNAENNHIMYLMLYSRNLKWAPLPANAIIFTTWRGSIL
jgi:hypothetical protein